MGVESVRDPRAWIEELMMSDAPRGDAGPPAGDAWWGDQPDPAAPVATPPRNRNRLLVIGVFGLMVLVGAVVGGVLATHSKSSKVATANTGATDGSGPAGGFGGRRRPGARGTIASIDGSTVTLTTTNGSVSVVVERATTITDSVKGTLADVKPGDHVRVIGAMTGSTVADARSVMDTGAIASVGGFGGPGGGPPAGAAPQGSTPNGQGSRRFGGSTNGTVTSIEGNTLVVKTTAGATVRITTSASTVVQLTKKIALTDLAKGDTVTVVGTTSGTTITATAIRRGDLGFRAGGGGPGAGGPGAGGPGGGFDGSATTLPGA